ncbi:hypothetical protein DIPPA_04965 [Diplonema papillatum]|nr:hypothetical protein DIPPA_04965 [Diplonema papillatum]KAJ9466158.1 hypothetical protein DIPPA_04965 [Diplonema papillatum]
MPRPVMHTAVYTPAEVRYVLNSQRLDLQHFVAAEKVASKARSHQDKQRLAEEVQHRLDRKLAASKEQRRDLEHRQRRLLRPPVEPKSTPSNPPSKHVLGNIPPPRNQTRRAPVRRSRSADLTGLLPGCGRWVPPSNPAAPPPLGNPQDEKRRPPSPAGVGSAFRSRSLSFSPGLRDPREYDLHMRKIKRLSPQPYSVGVVPSLTDDVQRPSHTTPSRRGFRGPEPCVPPPYAVSSSKVATFRRSRRNVAGPDDSTGVGLTFRSDAFRHASPGGEREEPLYPAQAERMGRVVSLRRRGHRTRSLDVLPASHRTVDLHAAKLLRASVFKQDLDQQVALKGRRLSTERAAEVLANDAANRCSVFVGPGAERFDGWDTESRSRGRLNAPDSRQCKTTCLYPAAPEPLRVHKRTFSSTVHSRIPQEYRWVPGKHRGYTEFYDRDEGAFDFCDAERKVPDVGTSHNRVIARNDGRRHLAVPQRHADEDVDEYAGGKRNVNRGSRNLSRDIILGKDFPIEKRRGRSLSCQRFAAAVSPTTGRRAMIEHAFKDTCPW